MAGISANTEREMFLINLYTQKLCSLICALLVFIILTATSAPVLAVQQRLMVYGDSLVAGYGLSAGKFRNSFSRRCWQRAGMSKFLMQVFPVTPQLAVWPVLTGR